MTDLTGFIGDRITQIAGTEKPVFAFNEVLSGVVLNFRAWYSGRVGDWHLDVLDAEGSPILTGSRATAGTDVFENISDSRIPAGRLFVTDRTGNHLDPDRRGFFDGRWLVWVPDDQGIA